MLTGENDPCVKQSRTKRAEAHPRSVELMYNHLPHHRLTASALLPPVLPTQAVLHNLRTGTVPYSQREEQTNFPIWENPAWYLMFQNLLK